MFTGLVAELGKITAINKDGNSYKLSIAAKIVLDGLRIGDSVAVNGTCLTVVFIDTGVFTAEVMPETAQNTVIPHLKTGDRVNLERTLRLGDRLDGHMVSGHIDFTGKLVSQKTDGIASVVTISAPPDALRYIIHKGSVAVDGISLTVCALGKDFFAVSLIPHTVANTTLGHKKTGDVVNIETDLIGKYVERLLSPVPQKKTESLTRASLLENGFLEE